MNDDDDVNDGWITRKHANTLTEYSVVPSWFKFCLSYLTYLMSSVEGDIGPNNGTDHNLSIPSRF